MAKESTRETFDQALAKGGRWVRAFNRNIVVTPAGKFVGVPDAVDPDKYAPGNPDAKTAVLKGKNKPKLLGKTSLRKLTKRKLRGHAKRLDMAIEKGNVLKQAVSRDLGKVKTARRHASAEMKRREMAEAHVRFASGLTENASLDTLRQRVAGGDASALRAYLNATHGNEALAGQTLLSMARNLTPQGRRDLMKEVFNSTFLYAVNHYPEFTSRDGIRFRDKLRDARILALRKFDNDAQDIVKMFFTSSKRPSSEYHEYGYLRQIETSAKGAKTDLVDEVDIVFAEESPQITLGLLLHTRRGNLTAWKNVLNRSGPDELDAGRDPSPGNPRALYVRATWKLHGEDLSALRDKVKRIKTVLVGLAELVREAASTPPRRRTVGQAPRRVEPGINYPKGTTLTKDNIKSGVLIQNKDNPEWGTWRTYLDRHGTWAITGGRGGRILEPSEFKFWDLVRDPNARVEATQPVRRAGRERYLSEAMFIPKRPGDGVSVELRFGTGPEDYTHERTQLRNPKVFGTFRLMGDGSGAVAVLEYGGDKAMFDTLGELKLHLIGKGAWRGGLSPKGKSVLTAAYKELMAKYATPEWWGANKEMYGK